MQLQPDAEMTDFKLPPKPDPKEPVSVRMPGSQKERILWVVELWKELARAQGATKEQVEEIDFPYTLLRMIAGRTDEELKQWGGFPETPAQREAQLKIVRESVKKSHK